MSAYIILIRKALTDAGEMKRYQKLARQASLGHQVEPIVFYGEVEALENCETDGVAILKFPDMQQARDWYHNEEYQQAKQHRHLSGEYQVILTAGLD
ncbi:uncharacterized protein (DUF1330 family) [Acinetobacter calcoaceticus]|uniref:Uncharacterized protein (DUF1330 family) n=1 Tax=Acinetobacter calcoaceticus TaxID=471 RepID=A0A4R1XIB2_ACICA|nr:uncharacterized protein (DUF1330 family) [Acinetobacter calcoaceticus]